MARGRDEVDAEAFDVVHWAVQTDDLDLAAVARAGVHFADVEERPKARARATDPLAERVGGRGLGGAVSGPDGSRGRAVASGFAKLA